MTIREHLEAFASASVHVTSIQLSELSEAELDELDAILDLAYAGAKKRGRIDYQSGGFSTTVWGLYHNDMVVHGYGVKQPDEQPEDELTA